jgi:hypothetical protein
MLFYPYFAEEEIEVEIGKSSFKLVSRRDDSCLTPGHPPSSAQLNSV